MNFVEYEVKILGESTNYECQTKHGITVADTYTEAVEKIESYYDEIEEITCLFMNEESSCYEFEETHDEMWHGKYYINFKKWQD